jgi:hypothetical protein
MGYDSYSLFTVLTVESHWEFFFFLTLYSKFIYIYIYIYISLKRVFKKWNHFVKRQQPLKQQQPKKINKSHRELTTLKTKQNKYYWKWNKMLLERKYDIILVGFTLK